jgi:hypothetical protein
VFEKRVLKKIIGLERRELSTRMELHTTHYHHDQFNEDEGDEACVPNL